jgi:hypothetical protein
MLLSLIVDMTCLCPFLLQNSGFMLFNGRSFGSTVPCSVFLFESHQLPRCTLQDCSRKFLWGLPDCTPRLYSRGVYDVFFVFVQCLKLLAGSLCLRALTRRHRLDSF